MLHTKPYVVFCLGLLAGVASHAQSQDVTQQPQAGTQLIQSTEGRDLFKAYCASCHGTNAKGTGPMSEWLKVITPDLTQISIRAGGTFPLARVQRIISGEENVKSAHATREMPVWGPIFSQVAGDRDWGRMRVYNLAEFLQQLQQRK